MIYDAIGTPLGIALAEAGLRLVERAKYRRPVPYVISPDRTRAYKVAYDKTGAPYRVFRSVHVHRPGRGYAVNIERRENLRRLLKEDIAVAFGAAA